MKRFVSLFWMILLPLVVLAEDEVAYCKTDVYFANGIKTEERDAVYNTYKILKPAIKNYLGAEDYAQKIGKVNYAYNETHGMAADLLESFLQKIYTQDLIDLVENTAHGRDLEKQVKSYQASIENEHRVVVVAHSQGNLFTYDAFNQLSPSHQSKFEAISVASPKFFDIKGSTTRIDYDNDVIPRIASLGVKPKEAIPNNVRVINWESVYDLVSLFEPDDGYTHKTNLGKTITTYDSFTYKATEGGVDFGSKTHSFRFYMGEPLSYEGYIRVPGDSFDKKIEVPYLDPFTQKTMIDTQAKSMILDAINTKLGLANSCQQGGGNDEEEKEEEDENNNGGGGSGGNHNN